MKDTYKHIGLRNQLVEELYDKGITNEAVLNAINVLPRHFFMDSTFEAWAYQDKAFQIGFDQTISQPFTVATQTSLLEIDEGDKVLEIGTGSGYQSCILSILGAKVFTIERQEGLYLSTRQLFAQLKFNSIKTYLKDGYLGLPNEAPFDKILVTAGAEEFPEILGGQLKIGGVLVIPIGGQNQTMYKFTKIEENKFKKQAFGNFQFVPFLEGLNKTTKK